MALIFVIVEDTTFVAESTGLVITIRLKDISWFEEDLVARGCQERANNGQEEGTLRIYVSMFLNHARKSGSRLVSSIKAWIESTISAVVLPLAKRSSKVRNSLMDCFRAGSCIPFVSTIAVTYLKYPPR